MFADRRPQLGNSNTGCRCCAQDRRTPTVDPSRRKIQHAFKVSLCFCNSLAVGLVDHEDVGDLHETGLVGLNGVAPSRVHHDHGGVGRTGDLDFHLTDTNRFEQHPREAGGVEHAHRRRRGERQAAEMTARGHRPDEHASIEEMVAHADSIAEDRTAGVGRRRVNRQHGHLVSCAPGFTDQSIGERALPGTGGTRDADRVGTTAGGPHLFGHGRGIFTALLHDRQEAGERGAITGRRLFEEQKRIPAAHECETLPAVRVPAPIAGWIAPPVALARGHVRLIIGLAIVAAATGYQGSVSSAALTYAAREWGTSPTVQSRALAIMRGDILLALVFVRAADRFGRRRVLLAAAVAGPMLTALCGLSPGIAAFTALQVLARSCVTSAAILIGVLGVESLPAGARAWSSGVIVVAAALGSALTLVALPITDASTSAWRWLFAVPLVSLPLLRLVAVRVGESERFVHVRERASHASAWRLAIPHWRRLLVVGFFFALLAFESGPSRQLQNDFLRRERGFDAFGVALFGIATNAPGVIGLLVGGRIADRRGRRFMLTIAIGGFAIGDAGLFLTHGSAQWFWSVAGAMVGGASLPALGVYAAELFPTAIRSTSNGLITMMSRVGGGLGLLFVSAVGTAKRVGPAIAMTTATLWVALILLNTLMPETAGRELEELNPEDAVDVPAGSARSAPPPTHQ